MSQQDVSTPEFQKEAIFTFLSKRLEQRLSSLEALRFANERTLDYIQEKVDHFSQELNIMNIYSSPPKPESLSEQLSAFCKDLREGKLPADETEETDAHGSPTSEVLQQEPKRAKGHGSLHNGVAARSDKVAASSHRSVGRSNGATAVSRLNDADSKRKNDSEITKSRVTPVKTRGVSGNTVADKKAEAGSRHRDPQGALTRNKSKPDIRVEDKGKTAIDRRRIEKGSTSKLGVKPTRTASGYSSVQKVTPEPSIKDDCESIPDDASDTSKTRSSKHTKTVSSNNLQRTGGASSSITRKNPGLKVTAHKTQHNTTNKDSDVSPGRKTGTASSALTKSRSQTRIKTQPPSPSSTNQNERKSATKDTRSRTPVPQRNGKTHTDDQPSGRSGAKRSTTPVPASRNKVTDSTEVRTIRGGRARQPIKAGVVNADTENLTEKPDNKALKASASSSDLAPTKKPKKQIENSADTTTPSFGAKENQFVSNSVKKAITQVKVTEAQTEPASKPENGLTSFRDPHNSTLQADDRWDKGLLSLDSREIEAENLLSSLDKIEEKLHFKEFKEEEEQQSKTKFDPITEENEGGDKSMSPENKRIKLFSSTSSSKKRNLELNIEMIERDAAEEFDGDADAPQEEANEEDDDDVNEQYSVVDDEDDFVNGDGGTPLTAVEREEELDDDDELVNGSPKDINETAKKASEDEEEDDINGPAPGTNVSEKATEEKIPLQVQSKEQADFNISFGKPQEKDIEDELDDVNATQPADTQQSSRNTAQAEAATEKQTRDQVQQQDNQEEDVNGPAFDTSQTKFEDQNPNAKDEDEDEDINGPADSNVNTEGVATLPDHKEVDAVKTQVDTNLQGEVKNDSTSATDPKEAQKSEEQMDEDDDVNGPGTSNKVEGDATSEAKSHIPLEQKPTDPTVTPFQHSDASKPQIEQDIVSVSTNEVPSQQHSDNADPKLSQSESVNKSASEDTKTADEPSEDSKAKPSTEPVPEQKSKKTFVVPKFKSTKRASVKLPPKKTDLAKDAERDDSTRDGDQTSKSDLSSGKREVPLQQSTVANDDEEEDGVM